MRIFKQFEQRPIELIQSARRKLLRPIIASRETFRHASCYTISRRAVKRLVNCPELQNSFAVQVTGSPDFGRMGLMLGAALSYKKDEFLVRGAIRTALLTRQSTLFTRVLNTHFGVSIPTRYTGDMVDKEGSPMLDRQHPFLYGLADLLNYRIPFYGLFILAESMAVHWVQTSWCWGFIVSMFSEPTANAFKLWADQRRVDLFELAIEPSVPVDRKAEEAERQTQIIDHQFSEVMLAVQAFLDARAINGGALGELKLALRQTLDRTTYEALRDRDARIEADRGLDRKLQYMQGVLAAVGHCLGKAADPEVSIRELANYAGEEFCKAVPFAINFMTYRSFPEDKKAKAVGWGGRGIYGLLAKLQGIKLKGKMEVDLVMGGDPPRLVEFEQSPTTGNSQLISEVGEQSGAAVVGADREVLEDGLRFVDENVSERIKGQSSLVAECILTGKPMLAIDTEIYLETGIATAQEMISGREVHPNPNMVRALSVQSFMVAPNADGAMLCAVKLPDDMEKDEMLRIMDVFTMYSRLIGLIMRARVLSDELRIERERADRLASQLRTALGGHMDERVARAIEQATISGDDSKIRPQPAVCTVMFTDIIDSTGISRAFDHRFGKAGGAARLGDFFTQYRDYMGGIAKRYNGILDKYIGDGVLFLWGTPLNPDDHQESAVNAAIMMQREARRFMAETEWGDLFDQLDLSFGMRIGIYSGDVTVGVFDSKARSEFSAIGDTVNRAQRLEGQADCDKDQRATGILCSDETIFQCSEPYLGRQTDEMNRAIISYLREDLADEDIISAYFSPLSIADLFPTRQFKIRIGKTKSGTRILGDSIENLEEEIGVDICWDERWAKRRVLEQMLAEAAKAEDESAQMRIGSLIINDSQYRPLAILRDIQT
ncbi:MAG: adenylate/guanylate cyclase domain-containing protein [Candidatus Margulisiibacteriota bacterium]